MRDLWRVWAYVSAAWAALIVVGVGAGFLLGLPSLAASTIAFGIATFVSMFVFTTALSDAFDGPAGEEAARIAKRCGVAWALVVASDLVFCWRGHIGLLRLDLAGLHLGLVVPGVVFTALSLSWARRQAASAPNTGEAAAGRSAPGAH